MPAIHRRSATDKNLCKKNNQSLTSQQWTLINPAAETVPGFATVAARFLL